jgi:hypothetical protein
MRLLNFFFFFALQDQESREKELVNTKLRTEIAELKLQNSQALRNSAASPVGVPPNDTIAPPAVPSPLNRKDSGEKNEKIPKRKKEAAEDDFKAKRSKKIHSIQFMVDHLHQTKVCTPLFLSLFDFLLIAFVFLLQNFDFLQQLFCSSPVYSLLKQSISIIVDDAKKGNEKKKREREFEEELAKLLWDIRDVISAIFQGESEPFSLLFPLQQLVIQVGTQVHSFLSFSSFFSFLIFSLFSSFLAVGCSSNCCTDGRHYQSDSSCVEVQ